MNKSNKPITEFIADRFFLSLYYPTKMEFNGRLYSSAAEAYLSAPERNIETLYKILYIKFVEGSKYSKSLGKCLTDTYPRKIKRGAVGDVLIALRALLRHKNA